MNEQYLKIRKTDIILTAALIVICLTAAVLPFLLSSEGSVVRIYVAGELYAEKSLSEDTVTSVDGLMDVVVSGGKVHVENSVCPSGVCEHSNPIGRSGDSIICLPNKIMIKISGEGETDAVSG